MSRKVNTPIAVLAFLVLVGFIYYLVAYTFRPKPVNDNPGLADIPPRVPGHDKPLPPPKDAGPVPGAIKR